MDAFVGKVVSLEQWDGRRKDKKPRKMQKAAGAGKFDLTFHSKSTVENVRMSVQSVKCIIPSNRTIFFL